MNDILLVNEKNEIIGTSDKLEVHQKGLLHRAFSVFIYKKHGNKIKLLLQQRHPQKYHSGGLWTNTCCSHPLPQENIQAAAKRRLKEEMGIETQLRPIGIFHYCASVGNNLIENEIDHVFIGEVSEPTLLNINSQEVINYQWLEINALKNDVTENPDKYTAWLPGALALLETCLL
jgi:isopentenyl-diphosphate delta-isomerase type 1